MWTNNEYEIRRVLDKIQMTVKKYRQSETLKSISRLSSKIYNEHKGYTKHENHFITLWFLMYLAKEALINTTDSRPATMPFNVMLELSDIFNGISDSVVDKDIGELGTIFLKLSYEQGQWQMPIRCLMPRNYFMFSNYDNKKEDNNKMCDIFTKYTDLDIGEFIIIGFAFSMCAHEKGVLLRKYLTESTIERYKGIFTDEKIEAFLKLTCISNKRFAVEQEKIAISNKVEKKYEFNILRSYPVIENNDKEYIVPVPRLLIDRCTSNLYYNLMEFYKKEYDSPAKFFSAYGTKFEEYVGYILNDIYDRGKSLLNVDECYSQDMIGKKADWIIIENDNVIILECKSCRIPLSIIQSCSLAEFQEYFKEHYLKNGEFQFSEIIKLYKEKGYKKVFPVMLINDIMPFYNDLRRFFKDEDFLDEIDRSHIQFMTIDEMERLVPNLKRYSMSNIIERKLNTENRIHEPFISAFLDYDDFDWETPIDSLEDIFEKVFYFGDKNATGTGDTEQR